MDENLCLLPFALDANTYNSSPPVSQFSFLVVCMALMYLIAFIAWDTHCQISDILFQGKFTEKARISAPGQSFAVEMVIRITKTGR